MDTKVCSKCGENKPITEFNKNKTKKDGLSYDCRECSKSYLKSHYGRNRQYYIDKASAYKQSIKDYVDEVKKQNPCSCGENRIACLQFHHTNPLEKEITISLAITNKWSVERVKKEIDKCIIVCSNCHIMLHEEEL